MARVVVTGNSLVRRRSVLESVRDDDGVLSRGVGVVVDRTVVVADGNFTLEGLVVCERERGQLSTSRRGERGRGERAVGGVSVRVGRRHVVFDVLVYGGCKRRGRRSRKQSQVEVQRFEKMRTC